jgi:hypothetical protein
LDVYYVPSTGRRLQVKAGAPEIRDPAKTCPSPLALTFVESGHLIPPSEGRAYFKESDSRA